MCVDSQIKTLAEVLDVNPLNIIHDGDDLFSSTEAPGQYLVLSDSDADTAWDDAIEAIIDECVLPEIPDHFHMYFDYESYKRDAKHDGRGHLLASYDGEEREVMIEDEYFFVYRVG